MDIQLIALFAAPAIAVLQEALQAYRIFPAELDFTKTAGQLRIQRQALEKKLKEELLQGKQEAEAFR